MKYESSDLSQGPILPQMIKFTLPILFLGLLQHLFNVADVVLAGQLGTSGSDAVAAVGATTALRSLLTNFFLGCATGSAVAVSHALGSKNQKDVDETVHTSMLLSVVIGVILTVTGVVISGPLLHSMATPENILEKSTVYLQTIFLSTIPTIIYNFAAAILRANGETKKPLLFFLLTAPVKLILTYIFVSVFNLDLVGIALSTFCSQTIAAILAIDTLIRSDNSVKLRIKELRFYRKPLFKILRLGIPSGIQSSTYSLSNVVIQSSINSLSFIPGFITGNAAACNIELFAEIVTGAFLNAAMSFVGQNVGAKKYDRVKRSYLTSLMLCTIMVTFMSVVVIVFSKQLLGLFITDSQQAISWGMVRIAFIFGPLVIQGLMDTTAGALRGLGVSVSNAIISLAGFCGVRILWCLTVFQIPKYHVPQTIYVIYPITWTIIAIVQFIIFYVVYKQQKRKLQLQTV